MLGLGFQAMVAYIFGIKQPHGLTYLQTLITMENEE